MKHALAKRVDIVYTVCMKNNEKPEAFTTTTCNIWLRDGFAARPLTRVAQWVADWDGVPHARFALESPTQVSSDGRTVRCFVEVKVTGRKWRFDPCTGMHRMTCRVRFIHEDAADDSDWIVGDIMVNYEDQRAQALADCGGDSESRLEITR